MYRIAFVNRPPFRSWALTMPRRSSADRSSIASTADGRDGLRNRLLRARMGEVAPFDARIVRPDGTLLDVSVTAAPLPFEGDRTVQIVVRETTAQQQAFRDLRDSEERLTLAVAGALEGVWDWNLETNAVVYSSRWKQMLGYSDDEIEPHVSAWERLVHPDDRSRADQANDSVARGERATYEASSGSGTRTATTSTCCRVVFRCGASRADRSCASWARISISPIRSAPKPRSARTKSD
jgi:PAS domain-containing protein